MFQPTSKRLTIEAIAICTVVFFLFSNVLSQSNESMEIGVEKLNVDGYFNSQWRTMYESMKNQGLSDRIIFAIGTWVAHEVSFVGLNLLLFLVYRFNLFPKYKIQNEKYPDWPLVKEALKRLFVDHFIVNPFAFYGLYSLYVMCGSKMSTPLPLWSTTAYHLFGSFVINETLFYWLHRALHHRSIYKYIHKEHHRFKVPIGIAAEYAHPVEVILADAVPTFAGSLILGSHVVVMWIWLCIRLWETIDTHSGYRFPFSPWGVGDGAGRHDFHHSHNVGCYGGSLVFWDWICGTDKCFLEHVKKEKLKKT